jgi:hypothetical protein
MLNEKALMKIVVVILLFLFTSCAENKTTQKSNKYILNFGAFSIKAPDTWLKIKNDGVDSYAGQIRIDNTDTLSFDLGWYSNPLTEPDPQIIERSDLKYININDTSEFIIVDNRRSVDIDKYRKNNIRWDTIDGYKAKIVFPRQSGIGITGVYIDSVWKSGSSYDKFNFYGRNLTPENETKVLMALKTLKFHKKK